MLYSEETERERKKREKRKEKKKKKKKEEEEEKKRKKREKKEESIISSRKSWDFHPHRGKTRRERKGCPPKSSLPVSSFLKPVSIFYAVRKSQTYMQ